MKAIVIRCFVGAVLGLVSIPAALACDVVVPFVFDGRPYHPQEEVTNAVDASPEGATICLESGGWLFTTPLILKPNQTLKSRSGNPADVRLRAASNGPLWMVLLPSGSRLESVTVHDDVSLIGGQPRADVGGALVYQASGATISNSVFVGFAIPIGVNQGSNVLITQNTIRGTGGVAGRAEPAIWVYQSSAVTVRLNKSLQQLLDERPLGDGEFSCFDSLDVVYEGNEIRYSGASGMYMNNCDNVTLADNIVTGAGEWGLDVVNGSSGFLADGNDVTLSRLGGAVYEERTSGAATFRNNVFLLNRNYDRYCNGVNVFGDISNVTFVGNIPNNNNCSR